MFTILSDQDRTSNHYLTITNIVLILLSYGYIALRISPVVNILNSFGFLGYEPSWLSKIAIFLTQYYWVIAIIQIIVVLLIFLKWRTLHLGLKMNKILRICTISIAVFIILMLEYDLRQTAFQLLQ